MFDFLFPKTRAKQFRIDWNLLLEVSKENNNLSLPDKFKQNTDRYDWFVENWNNMLKTQKTLIMTYCSFNNSKGISYKPDKIPYFSTYDEFRRRWGKNGVENIFEKCDWFQDFPIIKPEKVKMWITANWGLFSVTQKRMLDNAILIDGINGKTPNFYLDLNGQLNMSVFKECFDENWHKTDDKHRYDPTPEWLNS